MVFKRLLKLEAGAQLITVEKNSNIRLMIDISLILKVNIPQMETAALMESDGINAKTRKSDLPGPNTSLY